MAAAEKSILAPQQGHRRRPLGRRGHLRAPVHRGRRRFPLRCATRGQKRRPGLYDAFLSGGMDDAAATKNHRPWQEAKIDGLRTSSSRPKVRGGDDSLPWTTRFRAKKMSQCQKLPPQGGESAEKKDTRDGECA